MKKIIDITTTATIRPELLEKTYSTFWENIFSKCDYDFRLVINIDPIGDDVYCQGDVLRVAESFFSKVVYNCPQTPNFSLAVKWVWSNSTSDYVFHLEDMWKSHHIVDLNKMVHILDNYSKVAYVNLHKYVLSDGSYEPRFYDYHNKEDRRLFLQIQDPLLSPGLFRGSFVRKIYKLMNDKDNPELQIWGDKDKPNDGEASIQVKKFLSSYDYVIYAGNWKMPFWLCGRPEVDMFAGRKWKNKHGFYKKTHFTPWEKI